MANEIFWVDGRTPRSQGLSGSGRHGCGLRRGGIRAGAVLVAVVSIAVSAGSGRAGGVASGGGGRVVALDAKTGRQRWATRLGVKVFSAAAVDGDGCTSRGLARALGRA
jgi:outer membrane protein assembly factor BamB